jgi:hypothetical protein
MRRFLQADPSDTPSSYSTRLRDIGGVLDARGCHALAVVEVEGGFLVRASSKGSRLPELFEFLDGDALPQDALESRPDVRRRLFPGGYAPFLEALGARLDRRGALSISIVEGTDFLTVGGFAPVALEDGEIAYEALDLLLLPEDILALLGSGTDAGRDAERPTAPARESVSSRPQPAAGQNPVGAAAASVARMLGIARPQASRMRG